MNLVKGQIIKSLQFALEQCNFADVGVQDNPEVVNDLPPHAAWQTFGLIRETFISLGERGMFEHWCECNEWKKED